MKLLFISHKPLGWEKNIWILWEAFREHERTFCLNRIIDDDHPCPNGLYDFTEAEHDGFDFLITDGFIVSEIKDKKHLKIISLEHGISGLKKVYRANGEDKPEVLYSQVDIVVTSSNKEGEIIRQSTRPDVEIWPIGMPRMDWYFESRHIGDGNIRYLYAPTWRTQEGLDMPEIDWGYISASLRDDESMLVAGHPWSEHKHISGFDNVIDVAHRPIEECIAVCDVLITDYSSVLWEAYLLDKPCVLYHPDSLRYLEKRQMYFDYPFYYSSYNTTSERLILSLCREAKANGMGEREKILAEQMLESCDGHAVSRVVRSIRELYEEERRNRVRF